MGNERRELERHPSFEFVDVVAREPGGKETTLQVMTRDRSLDGVGGIYVGQDTIDAENEFVLKRSGKPERELKLAWGKRIADYVYILGFKFTDR